MTTTASATPASPSASASAARDPRRLIRVFSALLALIVIGYACAGVLLARRGPRPARQDGPFALVPGSLHRAFAHRALGAADAAPPGDQRAARAGGGGMMSAAAQRLSGTSATVGGELEFALIWDGTSDIDLGVVDPTGAVIDAEQARSAAGGVMDVDANPTPLTPEGARLAHANIAPGARHQLPLPPEQFDGVRRAEPLARALNRPESLFTRTPVEHIHFAAPPKGTYAVRVRCYSWREPTREPLRFTIQVSSKGQVLHEVTGMIGPDSFVTHGMDPTVAFKLDVR